MKNKIRTNESKKKLWKSPYENNKYHWKKVMSTLIRVFNTFMANNVK